MLLFIIMNMFNSKVYFMRQNASVSVEYAITQGRLSVPCSVARTHCDLSACIIGRLCPSYTIRAMSFFYWSMSFLVCVHCHPSAPNCVPFASNQIPSMPSHVPSVLSHAPSTPNPLLSAHIETNLRPFAFCLHIQEEVYSCRLQSTHAWIQYKKWNAIVREAKIFLCFRAWNSTLSSLRETTYIVGC